MINVLFSELKFSFIRAPGPGGQNVNKVATAVLLRFNIFRTQSLTEDMRERLIKLMANKINHEGELMIKASRFRTQERNKQDAIERLNEILQKIEKPPKKRKKTKPSFNSKQVRLNTKKLRAKTKLFRLKPQGD